MIGVINKCDTKQKKSHDFVFDLIRNAGPSKSKCFLKAGWYGLRNRQASELEISNSERDRLENEFFKSEEWRSLDSSKLGRHNLKKALIKLRNNHIHQSIPSLLTEIQVKLDICNERISRLREPLADNQAQFKFINRIATRYSLLASNALEGNYRMLDKRELQARGRVREDLDDFYQDLHKNGNTRPFSTAKTDADALGCPDSENWLKKILQIPTYKWIHDQVLQNRATEFPGEVNPEVRVILWKTQTENWMDTASSTLRKIEQTVERANMALFEQSCPDERLRTKLRSWLSDDFQKASENARSELKRIVDEERSANLFTMNPQLSVQQKDFGDARIKAIVLKCRATLPLSRLPQAPIEPESTVNKVSSDQIIQGHIYDNTIYASILNTHDTLAAYYEIAKCRFIDNVSLQVVERHLLGPDGPLQLFNSDYVSKRLYGEKHKDVLKDLTSEDPMQINERDALLLEKESLEKSRRRVQEFQRS